MMIELKIKRKIKTAGTISFKRLNGVQFFKKIKLGRFARAAAAAAGRKSAGSSGNRNLPLAANKRLPPAANKHLPPAANKHLLQLAKLTRFTTFYFIRFEKVRKNCLYSSCKNPPSLNSQRYAAGISTCGDVTWTFHLFFSKIKHRFYQI
ncbi:hypothetical protein MmiHf6_04400 [Methanimicrococcus hongohii]|uniref:Uncharacterized protein n=1 Tax=Methanimicrococcus hongohii TaxID=3028295 RepID=A0AA96ZTW2_9EURY|nr:hypothetical protein MmiHf6_04400 [Methanimicrococcus sp. Hf6]